MQLIMPRTPWQFITLTRPEVSSDKSISYAANLIMHLFAAHETSQCQSIAGEENAVIAQNQTPLF